MRLSIVIPVLNEAHHLTAFLAPLAPLRETGHEIIVVDGGSGDGTAQCAQSYADRVLTSSRGRARQMNTGAAAANGDVLLFLHADSALPENATQLIETAMKHSGRRWGRFNVRLSSNRRTLRLVAGLMNLRSQLTGVATGDQGIFVERKLFESIGGFPDIPLMEDVALSARLKQIERPICLGATITTSSRRWEKHGVWPTIWLMWRLRYAYWRGADPVALARIYYPDIERG